MVLQTGAREVMVHASRDSGKILPWTLPLSVPHRIPPTGEPFQILSMAHAVDTHVTHALTASGVTNSVKHRKIDPKLYPPILSRLVDGPQPQVYLFDNL